MNLTKEIRPGSTNERILNILLDKEWHFHYELVEESGLARHQVSAAIHRLQYYYGWILQRKEEDGGADGTKICRYKLVSRCTPEQPLPLLEEEPHQNGHLPDLGSTLKVVGHLLHPKGVQILLKSTTDNKEYELLVKG